MRRSTCAGSKPISASMNKRWVASGSSRNWAARLARARVISASTRQDFAKNLIAMLQTGSDNLVLADTNEEGANLLALQTRQQLSTTALSLSAQADQAILKIL